MGTQCLQNGNQYWRRQEDCNTTFSIYDISLVATTKSYRTALAYVYTREPITFNEQVKPICLWGSELQDVESYSGFSFTDFIWAGWNTETGKLTELDLNSSVGYECKLPSPHSLSMYCNFDLSLNPFWPTMDLDGSGIVGKNATFYQLFGVSNQGHFQPVLHELGAMLFVSRLMNCTEVLRDVILNQDQEKFGEMFGEQRSFNGQEQGISTLNPTYENGTSLLHLAARVGNMKAVEIIYGWQKGYNQTIIPIDNAGNTPIHEAYTNGHYEIARYLLEKLEDDSLMQMSLAEKKLETIGSINEMINSTESGNFSDDPMEILDTLNSFA